MPCEWISIDALDISGDVQLDMVCTALTETLETSYMITSGMKTSCMKTSGNDSRSTPAHTQDHDIYKRRLDSNGVAIGAGEKHSIGPERLTGDQGSPDCGSCYGAGEEGECCNTCEEVCWVLCWCDCRVG